MTRPKNPPAAHSPGPWLYHTVLLDVTDAEGFSLMELYDQGPRGVTHANGFVIAAAPELLDAAKAVVEEFQCPDGDDAECGALMDLRDAISKAERRP